MVTGLNTDVEHNGRVFHVQSEDQGVGKPVLQSLVFCAGEIITVLEVSYERLVASPRYSDAAVSRRLAMQHHRLINDINEGKFDAPAGSAANAEATAEAHDELTELVLDYLQQDSPYDVDREKTAIEKLIAPPSHTVGGVLSDLESEVTEAARKIPGPTLEPERGRSPSAKPAAERKAVAAVRTPVASAAVGVSRRRSRRGTALAVVLIGAIVSIGAGAWWLLRPNEDAGVVAHGSEPTPDSSPVTARPEAPPPVETEETPPAVQPGASPGSTPTAPVETKRPDPPPPVRQTAPREKTPPIVVPPAPIEVAAEAGGTLPFEKEPGPRLAPAPAEAAEGSATERAEAALALPVPAAPLTAPEVLDIEPQEPEAAEPAQPVRATDTAVAGRVRPGALVALAQVDVAPTATRREIPEYSRKALKKRHQGRVELNLLIDERGNVAEVEVVSGIEGSDLTDVAAATAGLWKFTPARKGPHPVKVWKPVAVVFSISDGKSTRVRVAD